MMQNRGMDLKDIVDSYRSSPPVVSTRKQTSLYPSSASISFEDEHGERKVTGSCLRQQYYQYIGEPKPAITEARITRIREMGNYLSEMMVDDFKRAGLYVADEISFHIPSINVSGRFDIMIKDPYTAPAPPTPPRSEDLIGVECKSVGGYHNKKGPILSTRDTILAPKVEHVLQSMIYLDYYQQYGIKKWLVIYVDRETLAWTIHTLTFNADGSAHITNEEQVIDWPHVNMANIRDRYERLWQFISSNELPPRDFYLQYPNSVLTKMYARNQLTKTDSTSVQRKIKKNPNPSDEEDPILRKGDWQCNYCDFKEKCWSNDPRPGSPGVPHAMTLDRKQDTRDELEPNLELFV